MIPHWTHRSARKIVCLISLVLTASGAKAQAPFHLLEATIDGITANCARGASRVRNSFRPTSIVLMLMISLALRLMRSRTSIATH